MKFVALVGLVAGLWCYHLTSGVTHKLEYLYTATSGISNFPEFVDVGVVDGIPISRYDSNTHRKVPLQKWMEEVHNQQYWVQKSKDLMGTEQSFKVNIQTAMKRFNQTEGLHVFQWMYGCQWDDDSGATDSSFQYGYDGEDFFSADLKNMRWIAPVSQALLTKSKYERGTEMQRWKAYATSECIDWIKKYLKSGSSVLGRKDSPEVTIFKKDSSSVIVCHATGFYPEGVMITWKKDGVEMHEDVDVGETLPNTDGTFQKRAVLNVSSEEWKKSQYTCEVAHKSGSSVRTVNPDELDNGGSISIGLIVGLVICGILFIVFIAGVFWWRQKNNGFMPANKDDGSATSSEEGLRRA